MIVLWITLLLLHRGSAHIPVTTVQLGGPVTFTCLLPKTETIRRDVHWYKQNIGDTLKIIWTQKDSAAPQLAPEFTHSKWEVKYDKNFSNLTILRTNQEDEGIYHCGITEWLQDTKWTGTYLLVKGHTQTSKYTIVQEKTDPPRDSVTLQCSVLAESDNKSCPGGHRVFWFREGTRTSHPRIIYSDGNRHHKCEKRSETQQSCVFHFSKNVSASDEGTYHCAVAICGEILSGNGTTLAIQEISMRSQRAITAIFLLCAVLVITLIVIAALVYTIKTNNSDHCKATVLQKHISDQKRQQNKHTQMYSAAVFTMMKVDRSKIKTAKAAKWQKINMAVKASGLD